MTMGDDKHLKLIRLLLTKGGYKLTKKRRKVNK